MKLNTIISVDGREGTICYHNLDGDGGVWGRHWFEMPDGGFGAQLPAPDFMLRDATLEPMFRREFEKPDLVCVGERFTYVDLPEDREAAVKAAGVK